MPRPKKPDPAHAKTDEMLAGLERRIAEEYAQAAKDMASKYEKYMRKFEAGIEKQRSLLDAGEITKKEYTDWVYRHTLMTDRWKEMRDVLAKDLENSRDIARKMAGEQVADVYALNHNYAVYDIEHSAKINTGLTLYNHDTAEYLLGDPRELMPGPSTRRAAEIARNKAMQWDKQKIQSAVLQGVLQGETPAQVAKRLQGVAEMSYNAAVRYARTMTTSAQNAGRYQAYHRAKKLGVELVIEWVAVLDNHTRHSHRMMHGQRRDIDEPFIITDDSGATFEIMYPADCSGLSDAPQSQIWNCRCTLKPMVKGFERETVKSSPGMGDMSFEEWQQAKATQTQDKHGSIGEETIQHHIANGSDITKTWERRPDQYDYAIEDVMDAQGFMGTPRVVSSEEFDRAVKEANDGQGFIAQRVYSGRTQEILDAHRESLYTGKWYVDCSRGGAMYGQGMYCAADFTGTLSSGIADVMDAFKGNGSAGSTLHYIETMTLDKSAKIARYADFSPIWEGTFTQEAMNQAMSEGKSIFSEMARIKQEAEQLRNKYENISAYIAAQGYDAVVCDDPSISGVYTVILNRTKLIIREP